MAATVLSLFSGYGGLELGLHAALGDARTVGYVEREAYAAAILLARMEDEALEPTPVWCGDVHELDPTPFLGVDWVTGGFPCQPFSVAGKREGQEDERWLWESGIVPLLRAIRPQWCLFENVPGLVRLGLGPVLRDLAVLGYDVEWDLFKASDVGASHRRERIFILGRLADAGCELLAGRVRGGESGQEREGAATRERRAVAQCDHTQLADAGCELLEGGDELGAEAEREDRAGRGIGRHLFAPGPADLDVWARVLTEAPQVEPSLCRVADGSAGWLEYRQDRLRALGNGVVPLQAAVAVRVLAERAGWDLR